MNNLNNYLKTIIRSLTRRIHGVQSHPFGANEASDPLQLSMSDAILEDDVVGEVDSAERFYRLAGRKAGHWTTVFGVAPFVGHTLGHWGLVVLHHLLKESLLYTSQNLAQIRLWIVLSSASRPLALWSLISE